MYVGLWMYVYSHTRKIPVSELQSNITITLTDEQAKIIWFTVTGDKNYRFTYYPFLFEIFQKTHQYNIGDIVAGSLMADEMRRTETLKRHVIMYATARYINRRFHWKDCIEYIASRIYMGSGIYGLDNASMYYYDKNYTDLSAKELIQLYLLSTNPAIYKDTENEMLKNKSEQILKNFTEEE